MKFNTMNLKRRQICVDFNRSEIVGTHISIVWKKKTPFTDVYLSVNLPLVKSIRRGT